MPEPRDRRRDMAKTSVFHRQTLVLRESRSLGPLSELLAVQLRRVDIMLTRGFARETDLPAGVISCLGLIVGNPGISQNELARVLGVDKSIIVALMHELERLGWARRMRSETDRRFHALQATSEGKAELERLAGRVKQFEDQLLSDIPPSELDHLRDLLDRMYASCVKNLGGTDP